MTSVSRRAFWLGLAARFLAGQSSILAINLITGLLLLRLLSIDQYAIYVTAGVLLAIGSLGADLGLSQALNTFASRYLDSKQDLSEVFAGAYRYRNILGIFSGIAVLVLAYMMLATSDWPVAEKLATVAVVLATCWVQSVVYLKKSILNARHDANALFQVGLVESLVRLTATLFCVLWPTALTALCINLLGAFVSRVLISTKCRDFLIVGAHSSAFHNEQLRKFIVPLVPGIIYYAIQGQIAIFLLSLYGYANSVAEVGALGRLGQILGVLMLLNPFLIQPYFARIHGKSTFVARTLLVIGALVLVSLLFLGSAYLVPGWWLFILGEQYNHLAHELPIAIGTSLLGWAGGTIYTLLVSRAFTRGQSWAILAGLAAQLLFLSFHGVNLTKDALTLNMMPPLAYLVVQILILWGFIGTWNSRKQIEP
jgi:O-antigen/teichoic acid export membrane protein